MARTPLAQQLREHIVTIGEAFRRKVTVEQVVAERKAEGISRREFLQRALVFGLATTVPVPLQSLVAAAANTPSVVIVGAGLAGLTAAYRLKQAGYVAQVYEAADRPGGRCLTGRNLFDEGQIIEHGGELIDQGHTAIRHLAQELGLTLDNLLQAEQNDTEPVYYVNGERYSYQEATDDIKKVWKKLHSDVSAASYPTLYHTYTQRGFELDHMSILDWINESVPGGVQSKLGQLLNIAYTIEYGGEISEQSSLNLLYLIGYRGPGQLRVFGPSDEKYHVRGGNDQIVQRMVDQLSGQVHTGRQLIALKRNSDGTYTLTFRKGQGIEEVKADKVVLTLPFSLLRDVDCSQAGFRALKSLAIQELCMATSAKLQLQFHDRHWRDLGYNGDTYADTGYQSTWEVTRGQAGRAGILNNFTGGDVGKSFVQGTSQEHAKQFLQRIEPVLPGLSAKWNGKVVLDHWTDYKWTRGSYSYWRVGHYTKFAGVEGEREGNCYFAGEHTSIDFQGYLNGAVESGERVVKEIIDDLKHITFKG